MSDDHTEVPADVTARVATVRARIEAAALAAGRDPARVTLVAVSKTHPPAAARAVLAAGVGDLGENRVQELLAKRPHVAGAAWHLVGQLQRNKVRQVVGLGVLVHSLDRRSLADAISARARDADVTQRVLVQVNVGADPAKSGCSLDDAADLVAYAAGRPHLRVEGLMTIPPLAPVGQDPAASARVHFASLRRVRDEVVGDHPDVRHLSMGMSADLEAAVAEGATMVRIGAALFGDRASGPWRPGGAAGTEPAVAGGS